MRLILLLFLYSISARAAGSSEEAVHLKACAQDKQTECEKLAAFYLSKSEWEKAFVVGEALCGKEIPLGCTFAGSSLLALGRIREARNFLSKACDKFEPLSCRSLGRLMDKAGELKLSNMYFKRACHYGMKETCKEVKDLKEIFSEAGKDLIAKIRVDCQNQQTESCNTHFNSLKSCLPPLTREDCLQISGHLTIYFRAKLLQAESKLVLLSLYAAQQKVREGMKPYSYDLRKVMKDYKPQEKYQYVFGFIKACGRKFVKQRRVRTHSQELYSKSYRNLSSRTMANILTFFSKGKGEDCYDPKAGYEAYAVGSLDPLNPTHLDIWRIDQDKRIENINDGLPLP